jgi:hypothetical protein
MASLYFGGVPTESDIKTLLDTYGVPPEHWTASLDDVATLLRVSVAASRFRTVTDRWRRMLYRDHNVLIARRAGKFIALDPSGRLSMARGDIRQGVRKTLRGQTRLLATERGRLSSQEQSEYDHATLVAAAVEAAARQQSKRPKALMPGAVTRQIG